MDYSRIQEPLSKHPAREPIHWKAPPEYDGDAPDCFCRMHGFYFVERGADGSIRLDDAGCPGCAREAAYQSFKAPLRDAFAMAALQGIMIGNTATPEFAARAAYRVADAMMKAREEV